jgi:hypothetical protein
MSKKPPFNIIRQNSKQKKGSNMKIEAPATFADIQPIEPTSFRHSNSLLAPTRIMPQRSNSKYSTNKNDTERYKEYLEQYNKAYNEYKNEEFTQQCDLFLTRIASDKKIPKEITAKFPVFNILVTLAKVFLLNEFEIAALGNILDNINWKFEEMILPGEAQNLIEFPMALSYETSDECKRFIIYLLLAAFSVKQFLNEPSEFEKIKTYCEKICNNLPSLFNRFIKYTPHKYQLAEMNKKYKALSKKDFGEDAQNIKDYNVIVDSIMSLTGSYASKKTFDTNSNEPMSRQGTYLFNNNDMVQGYENPPKPEKMEIIPPQPVPLKSYDSSFLDSITGGGIRIPTVVNKQPSFTPMFNRSGSSEFGFHTYPSLSLQKSRDEFDMAPQKKFKTGNNSYLRDQSFFSNLLGIPQLQTGNSIISNKGDNNFDDLNIPMPLLNKQSSNVSQPPEELPNFSRFNSTLSQLVEK